MPPRITWGEFKRIAKSKGCVELEEEFSFGKSHALMRKHGDNIRFVELSTHNDDDFVSPAVLRNYIVMLGLQPSDFGWNVGLEGI